MRYLTIPALIGLFLLLGPIGAGAVPTSGEIDRINAANQVFNQVLTGIPASVLDNAKGIAIIPGEIKAGFIFGGEAGQGVVLSRAAKGSWSPPAFITVAGGSFGLQIGGEARDIVLVFNTPGSIDRIENGRLDLGGDVSVAAGPIGGGVDVSTNTPEIYSYIRSFGAFAGATVQGSVLAFDYDANRDFYGVSDPLRLQARAVPEPARRLTCDLSRATGASTRVCS